MPLLRAARDLVGAAAVVPDLHEEAPSGIISLSWAFLIIPCIFLVGAFAWLIYNFSQPSEFPSSNGFGHADHNAEDDEDQGDDEKEQLLDAFNESQSHAATRTASSHAPSDSTSSASSWKINSKFSTTSRGGSVYTSYPDPNGTYTHSPKSSISSTTSPKSKRSSLTADSKQNRSVGSKAAKVLAFNRDRMMQDLEKLDPIDREELQRSSSRASETTRKSD